MIKFTLYSAVKAQRMQDRKRKLKAVKASFKDGIYIFVCLLTALAIIGRVDIKIQPKGISEVHAQEPIVVQIPVIKEVKTTDVRISKLKAFLDSKRSPLSQFAEYIVSQADKNDIGYTWITGIACIESACGLRLPQNSYNAWGLGGSQFMYFKSWEESIKYMSELIGTKYRHNMLQGIKQNYCPESSGCNPNWSFIVANASKEINK